MRSLKRVLDLGVLNTSVPTWFLITMLYSASTLIDSQLVFFHAHLSAITISSGIAFVAVYHLGALASVMVFGVSFLTIFWSGADHDIIRTATFLSIMVTLNALLGGILLRIFICQGDPFNTVRSVLIFMIISAIFPFLLSSLGGMSLRDYLDPHMLLGVPDSFLFWWLSGSIGCMVSAPLLSSIARRKLIVQHGYDVVILFALIGLLSMVFSGWFDVSNIEFPLQYLIFPMLLWAVFRCGLGVACVILLIGLVATFWGTTQGYGPFVRDTTAQTTFLLQSFFGVTGSVVLILHAALAERKAVEQEVQTAHDELEIRVIERTVALQDAMQHAEESNRTKSRFLAAASHDLRQPIHAMSLFSTALKNRLTETENANLVNKVQDSLTNLGAMLDGLLDMSRLEDDSIKAQPFEFPVQVILDDVLADYNIATAKVKNLDLKIVRSSAILYADQTLLSRIIGNFVSNAIRYTSNGRIVVGCRSRGDVIRIEVWDTGIGMSQSDLDTIFVPHRRLQESKRHAADGLGLGLSIAEGLARLMGYPINVESTLGAGSLFAIDVPKGTKTDSVADVMPEDIVVPDYNKAFNGFTVLVVDDDEKILDGMKTVLTDWGCQVKTAQTTKSALEAAQTLGRELGIVISDYHLSDNDTGIKLLHQINQETGRNIPAIIVSGDTNPERRHEIEDAGYFLLTKPIQPLSLRPLLRHLLLDT